MTFTVTCIGSDPLDLRETLERFANEQWLPAHVAPEQVVKIVLDQFKRTIALTLTVVEHWKTVKNSLLAAGMCPHLSPRMLQLSGLGSWHSTVDERDPGHK